MFLRSAFKYTSYFLLLKVINDKLFGKVRFQSMFTTRKSLKRLADDEKFEALFFSSVYDNKILAKDRVALLGYVLEGTKDQQMERWPLEVLDKGEVFDNERNYSSYKITKANLQKLLSRYGDEVVYFIFKPVPCALDEDYVAYEIIPADRNKMPFKRRSTETTTSSQLRNIQGTNAEASGLQTQSQEVTMMAVSRDYEVAGIMNPSPPATVDFEVEF